MIKISGLASDFWKTVYTRNKKRKTQAEATLRLHNQYARQNPPPIKLWSSYYNAPSGAYVHGKLSDYRLKQQQNFCCYCQERIFSKVNANIEHIFPSAVYPQFTFMFHNLAMSCGPCNSFKSNDDWFQVNKAELKYFKHQKNWSAFHPNFDDFNEHVRLFGIQTNRIHVRTYVGITPKGQKLCSDHLHKLTTYEIKGKANPSVVEALEKLSLFLAKVPTATPAAQAVLQKFATFLYVP